MKENETKTQKKPQTKGKKLVSSILNTVINVMIVIVLIVSIVIAVMAISSKANGISTLFGYTIQPIQSESMRGGSPDGYPGGDFGHGDLMIAKATGFDNNAVYEVGDIITYRTIDSATNEYMLIVHRIVDVNKDASGICTYQTQGDNRETSPVPDQQNVNDYIRSSDIASVFYSDNYQGKIIKGLGSVLDYLRTQQGFFLVVLLPMIIFFMYELVRVILNFANYKRAKDEEDKQQAVDAAVAVALASKEKEASSPEDMTPEQMEQFRQFMEFQKQQKAAQSEHTADPAPDAPASGDAPEDTES